MFVRLFVEFLLLLVSQTLFFTENEGSPLRYEHILYVRDIYLSQYLLLSLILSVTIRERTISSLLQGVDTRITRFLTRSS